MAHRLKGPAKRKKIGKHYYTRTTCKAAKTAVRALHKRGYMATVQGGCAYKGPKRKGARR